MTENEAIEIIEDVTWKDFGRHPDFPKAREKAIKALEEVQHWHTSVINPKIKNVFANTSTQICHNCDHKDEYIEELEAELEEYRTIGTPEELKAAMKYVYLAKKHGTVGQVIENCVKYEAIGTPEECRAAMEKQNVNKELESHDEKHILECCISLMQELVNEFAEWYRWQHGEDAIDELDEEERFCFRKSYFSIVRKLFLLCTNHSGGTSTRAKCEQLGVDSAEEIEFYWSEEE
mgnify:CR=1 FL=1